MADETIKIPDPEQLRDLANYFSVNWEGQFTEAANKVEGIFVTPGAFDAATKLQEHVKKQKENFATNLKALADASDELGAGLVLVANRYASTEGKNADVSTELNTTVTNVSKDLPGFDDYESGDRVSPYQDWED